MRHTYRVHLQRQPHYALLHDGQSFSADALTSAVQGAVVREVLQAAHGGYVVDIQLHRSSHEEALNDILVAAQQLGYSWLQATVTEWADNALGGFVVGGLGGGVAGSSSGDGTVRFFVALLGSIAGAVIGSFINSVKVVYEVRWTPTGWQLVEVPPVAAPGFSGELGLA